MHSPHHHNPPEYDFSSNSAHHHHHPYNNRGFKGRKSFYRGRGGHQSYNKHASWKSHVTVKEEPMGDTQSLLSRLEPTSDSLLNRLSPTKDGSPKRPVWRVSLAERISRMKETTSRGGDIIDVDETGSIANSRNDSPKGPSLIDPAGVLAEQLIADALKQGKELVKQSSMDEQESRESPGSEAAVDDLLVADDEQPTPSPSMPVHSFEKADGAGTPTELAVSASSRSASVDRATLIEQAKLLIAPLISRNARLRDPNMDPRIVDERVSSLVTEEQCLEFLRLAKESRSQLEAGKRAISSDSGETNFGEVRLSGHGRRAAPSRWDVKPTQRTEDGKPRKEGQSDDGMTTDVVLTEVERSSLAKRQRTRTAEPAEPARPYKTSRWISQPVHGDGSKLGREPPKAPRALRAALALTSTPQHIVTIEAPMRMATADSAVHGKPPLPTGLGGRAKDVGTRPGLGPQRLLELKKTPSYAGSEDMDTNSSANSSRRQSPVLGESMATLASISIEPMSERLASASPLPQDNATHTAAQTMESSDVATSSSLSGRIRDADQVLSSLANATLSGSLQPPSSQVYSSEKHTHSAPTTELSTVGVVPGIEQSTPAAASSQEVLSGSTGGTNAPHPIQPNDTNAAVGSLSESAIDARSGHQEHLILTDKSVRSNAGLPENGDESIIPSFETGSASEVHANADKEGLPCVDKARRDTGSTNDSPEAQRSPQMDSNADSTVMDRSIPVVHTDTVPSAATTSPSFDAQGSGTEPALPDCDSQVMVEDIGAPPDTASADVRQNASSPITIPMEIDSAVYASSDTASGSALTSSVTPPTPLQIPGLCFAEVGQNHATVHSVAFHVDDESAAAAKRWNECGRAFDSSASYAAFHLLCLHASDVQEAVEADQSMSPEAFATMLWKMKTKWPPRGQLIVEMNTHRESRAAWLPKQMGPDDGPIDVTPYIAPGDNIIRFVQLSGQADRLFVLYVGRPDGERANSPATNGWDSWLSSLGLQS